MVFYLNKTLEMFKFLIYLFLTLSTGSCHDRYKPKVVCYWEHSSGDISTINIRICTHIHYSFLTLDANTLLMTFESDGENHLKKLLTLRLINPKLKMIVALGGYADSGGTKYGDLITNASSRATFVTETVKFLNKYRLDGLDLDYEYPTCPQTVCNRPAEKEGFGLLLQELRIAFKRNRRRLSLSAAVNAGAYIMDQAYDFEKIARNCDYVNVMTYDNAGGWLGVTGHHSGFDWSTQRMNAWAAQNVSKEKLLMGIPFYGVAVQLADQTQHGLGAPITGDLSPMSYLEICNAVKNGQLTKELSTDGPIAYSGVKWLSYDNPSSAEKKARWVAQNNFGGILVWQVSQDDSKAQCCSVAKPMIKAIQFGLLRRGFAPSSYGCAA